MALIDYPDQIKEIYTGKSLFYDCKVKKDVRKPLEFSDRNSGFYSTGGIIYVEWGKTVSSHSLRTAAAGIL